MNRLSADISMLDQVSAADVLPSVHLSVLTFRDSRPFLQVYSTQR